MSRHRKIDRALSEMWIAMLTTSVPISTYRLSDLIGIPNFVISCEYIGSGMSVVRSDHSEWSIPHSRYNEVLLRLEQHYAAHVARGVRRARWNMTKLRKAIDALEHAWTLVQLGASGDDTARSASFDWTAPGKSANG